LQPLFDRLAAGDPAARDELGEHVYRHLRGLCELKLGRDFPAVAARHDLDSVVHTAWIDVATMLKTVQVNDPAHFLRLLGLKARQVLLDMAADLRRRLSREAQAVAGDPSSAADFDPAHSTLDPAKLAEWGDFHAAVAALPEDERTVVDLHYFCDIPQADIAGQLGLHPKAVSRLWNAAKAKLLPYLLR
jgi:RNA polymerase sigma factor (sigma-70 family)